MLFDRSMVIAPELEVRLEVLGHRPATLSVDGRNIGELHEGDAVVCTASATVARLVTFAPRLPPHPEDEVRPRRPIGRSTHLGRSGHPLRDGATPAGGEAVLDVRVAEHRHRDGRRQHGGDAEHDGGDGPLGAAAHVEEPEAVLDDGVVPEEQAVRDQAQEPAARGLRGTPPGRRSACAARWQRARRRRPGAGRARTSVSSPRWNVAPW